MVDSPIRFAAIVAVLVFSDLGKTPLAKKRAHEKGIIQPDHDDWLTEVFAESNVSSIIPSFFVLDRQVKDLVREVISSDKIHRGHVNHLEGGAGMFTAFKQKIREGISNDILDMHEIIHTCDVSASLSHENNEGSLSYTEDTYKGEKVVLAALRLLRESDKTEKEALEYCVFERGKYIGLDANNSDEAILIRLACFLRLYKEEDGLLLKQAKDRLPSEEWQVIKKQFALAEGFNSWRRNPTYAPAVLNNLLASNKWVGSRLDKFTAVLEATFCLASIMDIYGESDKNRNAPFPINFNPLALKAKEDPAYLTRDNFEVSDITFDEKGLLQFQQVKNNLSLSA